MSRRRSVLAPELARLSSWKPSALAVRLVIVAAGLAVMLVPGHPKPILVLAMLTGIAGWFAGSGVHGSPSIVRVACFAIALYLLLSSTALAAAVPVRARLEPQAALRWARRWLLHVGLAAAFAALSYGIEASIDGYGSYQIELAGLLGVVAVVGCVVWLFTRSPR
jgi:hypothetical protein